MRDGPVMRPRARANGGPMEYDYRSELERIAEALEAIAEGLEKVATELYMRDRDPGGGPAQQSPKGQ